MFMKFVWHAHFLWFSSFLKQHSDEAAVFQSFRDINELIKDMLELKGRYTTVETELKEMHDRYSQLSLQFAEVEGERQKLMMTLKNVRASKKSLQLNRLSSATPWDHSSKPHWQFPFYVICRFPEITWTGLRYSCCSAAFI